MPAVYLKLPQDIPPGVEIVVDIDSSCVRVPFLIRSGANAADLGGVPARAVAAVYCYLNSVGVDAGDDYHFTGDASGVDAAELFARRS